MDTKLQKEQRIILERLLTANPNLKLAISTNGTTQTYTRSQMRIHVENLDDVGLEYVNEQMEFMRALSRGDIHKMLQDIPDEE